MGSMHFTRDGKTLQLWGLTTATDSKRHHVFKLELQEEWVAELLLRHIRQRTHDALSRIRREAYEQGWKDAKARRKKQDYFPTNLEVKDG